MKRKLKVLVICVLAFLIISVCCYVYSENSEIECDFIGDEIAFIGHPYTFSYTLTGGSGEYRNISLQIDELIQIDGSGCTDKITQYDYSEGVYTFTPSYGDYCSIILSCEDASTERKYHFFYEITLLPNPDCSIAFRFQNDFSEVGKPISVNYTITGLSAEISSAKLSWVVWGGEIEPHLRLGEQEVSSYTGTSSFTPQFGDYAFAMIEGSDKDGHVFYAKSDRLNLYATSGQCGYNAYYTLDENGVLIISGNGPIYNNGFTNRKDITKVIIQDGITEIGMYAFSGCDQIMQVELPDSVYYIGTAAFSNCQHLKKISIPGSVSNVDHYAFEMCSDLQSVVLMEGVNRLEQYVFRGCSSLTNVVLPNTLKTIGYEAFAGCNSLQKITIPDSITYIDDSIFEGCNSLETIYINTCSTTAHNWAIQHGYEKIIQVRSHKDIVIDPALEPTTEKPGLTEGKHCVACGHIIVAQKEIPMLTSTDKVEAYVYRCYKIILGRAPDAGGLKTWYNELTSGRKTASEIIDRFVNSPEYINKHYNYGDSVDILYQAMLGRNADAGGKANWVKKLENGQTLAHVINGFCFSREFRGLCDNYGIRAGFVNIPNTDTSAEGKIKAFVQRCYRIILDREADPSGMQTWYEQLSSGKKAAAEIIDRFVNSPEFSGKNYNSGDSVEILYKAMLGRGSDAAGKANWVSKLDADQPFAVVINGFCVSKEFTGICASYGIKPGSVTVQPLSGQSEEELSMLALNAKEPITRRSETKPNRVEIINPSDTIDMNIGTAVQAVYINEEKAKEFIGRCYRVILGRDASAAELENWIGQMVNGTKTPDQIARGFLFSNEFKGKNVSNEDLVKILYKVYMNRDADPEGLKTWTEKLDSGMELKELLDTFSKTNEFKKVVSEMSK